MQFIGRHLNTIGILLLMTFCAAAAGLYWNVPGRSNRATATISASPAAVCPIHQAKTEAAIPPKGGCCGSKAVEKPGGCSHGTETNSAMSEAGCSH